MLNIASSTAVHWPTSPSPSVAAVASVTAVAPAQRSGSENRSGMGAERDHQPSVAAHSPQVQRPAQGEAPPDVQAAPLLPRQKPEGDQGKDRSAIESEIAKEQALETQAAEEARAAQKAQLIEVLSSVWKASAAVVDVVLGRGTTGGDIGGVAKDAPTQSFELAAGNGLSPVARDQPTASSGTAASGAVAGDNVVPLDRSQGDPVAYTEHGASTWHASEPGKLMSHRA